MNAHSAPGCSSTLNTGILKFLPEHVAAVLQDYAANTGLSETQVVELAIASFLDLEASTFANLEPSKLKSYAEMQARLEFLEETWNAAKEGKLTQQAITQAAGLGW